MNLPAYLARIGYHGEISPTIETLRGMHSAHFYSVPFENLDIARGVRIEVDEAVNFTKIVERRRGGFCLELSCLFAAALREIGFRVDVCGGRVMKEGRLAPRMTHMTLLVHLDEAWIADVGFGGRIAEPLRLRKREPQSVGERRYVVENDGDHWFVTCDEPGTPTGAYLFTARPRSLEEFKPACNWLQTSKASRFTQGNIVSLATPGGRVTLAEERLIIIEDGRRTEQPVPSPESEKAILKDTFGIVLDERVSGERISS